MPDKTKHLERADKHLRKNKMDAALEEFVAALEADPADNVLRQRAAELALNIGRRAEASRLLGEMFDQQAVSGEPATAAATYRKLAKVTTPTAERMMAYARLIEHSNLGEAVEVYEAALEWYRQRRRWEQASGAAAAIVRLAPTIQNLKREGEIAAEAGDPQRAAAALVRAGEQEVASGQDAYETFKRAADLVPADAGIALAFARAQLARKEHEAALTTLAPVLLRAPATLEEEVRGTYGVALLGAGRAREAEPFVWEWVQRDLSRLPLGYELMSALFASGDLTAALAYARRLERHVTKAGSRREFVGQLKQAAERTPAALVVLEYLAELYNAYSEVDYCATLLRLFELHYASGNYAKAGECLDRAAEVDAYESGHQQRLEMMRGKIDARLYNAIARRIGAVGLASDAAEQEPEADPHASEHTVLEDLMLQAEIFLQYGMRARAAERLERIQRLFPGEEANNEKLYELFTSAGMKLTAPPPVSPGAPSVERAASARGVDIARVSEATRTIYRQGNVKSVLFTAVNEIGRLWQASRCIAVLATPGKPPSIALEYVAPGLKQSAVMDIVKMVALVQPLALAHGAIVLDGDEKHADTAPRAMVAPLRKFIAGLGIESMVTVPLVEGDDHVGLLVVGDNSAGRQWQEQDVSLMKTVAEQVSLAVTNAKLRSLVKNLAVTDEHSGLLKRSSYVDMLISEVRRAQAQRSMLTVMLVQFGRAGEMIKQFGDAAVEQLMRDLGQLISSHTRQHDMAVRYDKTTIALMLAETNEQNAQLVAKKLKGVVAATHLPGSDDPPKMAAGIAEAVLASSYDPVDIVTELINRAEAALEAAIRQAPEAVIALPPVAGMVAGTA